MRLKIYTSAYGLVVYYDDAKCIAWSEQDKEKAWSRICSMPDFAEHRPEARRLLDEMWERFLVERESLIMRECMDVRAVGRNK